jgi:hypothetical protein
VRGQGLVVHHRCLEEVNHLLVLAILRPVARQIEGRVASPVFGELVAPEIPVWRALRDPVPVAAPLILCRYMYEGKGRHPGPWNGLVHVRQQIQLPKRLQESTYAGSLVRGHRCPPGRSGRGIRRRSRIVLTARCSQLSVILLLDILPPRTHSRSQYCVYEPLQKSGHSPCNVHVSRGSTWPCASSPAWVSQYCVLSTSPPKVSVQHESVRAGWAWAEQER